LGDASGDGIAGDVYAELIAENLERQAARKSSIEQRGLAVISTSAALVTLQFALVAVVVDHDSFELEPAQQVALGVSLALFVAAAVLGLLTNNTRSYNYVSTSQLERLTEPATWRASRREAQRRLARAHVVMLRTARARNGAKARLLRLAIIFEVSAVGALAICVALILMD
jgi:hypothetical protein